MRPSHTNFAGDVATVGAGDGADGDDGRVPGGWPYMLGGVMTRTSGSAATASITGFGE